MLTYEEFLEDAGATDGEDSRTIYAFYMAAGTLARISLERGKCMRTLAVLLGEVASEGMRHAGYDHMMNRIRATSN